MIRLFVYLGRYGGGGMGRHTAHILGYRAGRLVSSETGPTLAFALRETRRFFSARRRAKTSPPTGSGMVRGEIPRPLAVAIETPLFVGGETA